MPRKVFKITAHVSPETLKAAEEYVRRREIVRVEISGGGVSLWIGAVRVRSWQGAATGKRAATALAAAIQSELQRAFEQRARAVAKEGRYREVKHY